MKNSQKPQNIRTGKNITLILACVLAASLTLTGCSFASIVGDVLEIILTNNPDEEPTDGGAYANVTPAPGNSDSDSSLTPDNSGSSSPSASEGEASEIISGNASNSAGSSLPDISSLNLLASNYDGKHDYIEINNNVPFFTDKDMTTESYISLSELDELGRVGTAMMCAGPETITDAPRGEIGYIKPTGWMQHKYPNIVDEQPAMLYNRCHCLMYVLSGLNDEPRNLVTGTRHLNAETMLPFEENTVDYIERTGNHVIYRVTPVFVGDQLLCQGLLMEAKSVEDNGKYSFNVFCYNVQPDIEINYETGDNWHSKDYAAYLQNDKTDEEAFRPDYDVEKDYVLNQGNHKVHTPDCEAVETMNPKNKASVHDSLKDLVDKGYVICGECN